MEKAEAKGWIKGALYLSMAAFIAKLLSAVYKVPYQNMTGDIGYYVYQQVYPVYGIALVLGTYGFPLVIAKMTAQEQAKERCSQRLVLMFWTLFLFNGVLGGMLFVFADAVAQLMGDPQLNTPLRWLSLPFFLIAFLSVGRGYYQGVGNMLPAAVSQVSEQVVRVLVILAVAAWTMNLGQPYLAGTSAGLGAFAGGVAGIIVMLMYRRKKQLPPENKRKQGTVLFYEEWQKDVKELFITGVLVSASAMALILIQLYDALSVVQHLRLSGVPKEEALIAKGIYDRGWPLIQLGAVVTTAFSYGAIPFISKAFAAGDKQTVRIYVRQSLKICLVFGGAAAIGLISIMDHLNPMLFTDSSGDTALQLLSFTVLFGAVYMTCAALLHAVGKAAIAAGFLLLGIVLKGIGNYWAVPVFGMEGAAAATSVSFLLIAALTMLYMRKQAVFPPFERSFWLKWLFSLSAMAGGVKLLQFAMMKLFFDGGIHVSRTAHSILAMSGAVSGVILFIFTIWYIAVFDEEEWNTLPKLPTLLPHRNK
ncbi:polysaccharide transporter, PST family [Evansella caseinilytica]|uniref:Polysaccharide transporter, PST family n=1 Tax=Evansella caseinilytica TaxID=1503961 RepID=A0A1H3UVX3_9BACI|nr:polysaccharide biosynthesis protein [Evansella caseinilytica]SDZ66406.1 polysaccharide transporter, PST family [Evansella caseinilytica]